MNKRKYEFAEELSKEMENKPFSKISISEICSNMNCSRQSFYYYFKTLDECLVYYLKESFRTQIKEDFILSGIFNYFDNNSHFITKCLEDESSSNLFWKTISTFIKRILDFVFSKNIVEYLALYGEQKNSLVSFYTAGVLEIAKYYLEKKFTNKEKCISYCKAILGSSDETRSTILRFTH